MTHRLTASSLWRRELCPASAVLPESPRRKYADAEHGKAEHAKAEAAPPPGAEAEVAYALNVLSGQARRLEVKSRDYGKLAEGEIAGTADRVYVRDDHVLIEDLKSGVGYMQAEPKVNLQLIHNGLSAAIANGKDRAIVQLIYLQTGEVKDAEFDLFDFKPLLWRMWSVWDLVTQAERMLADGMTPQEIADWGYVKISDACWRCECVKACPLKSKRSKS